MKNIAGNPKPRHVTAIAATKSNTVLTSAINIANVAYIINSNIVEL
jgi:hypothetical protein